MLNPVVVNIGISTFASRSKPAGYIPNQVLPIVPQIINYWGSPNIWAS